MTSNPAAGTDVPDEMFWLNMTPDTSKGLFALTQLSPDASKNTRINEAIQLYAVLETYRERGYSFAITDPNGVSNAFSWTSVE